MRAAKSVLRGSWRAHMLCEGVVKMNNRKKGIIKQHIITEGGVLVDLYMLNLIQKFINLLLLYLRGKIQ